MSCFGLGAVFVSLVFFVQASLPLILCLAVVSILQLVVRKCCKISKHCLFCFEGICMTLGALLKLLMAVNNLTKKQGTFF